MVTGRKTVKKATTGTARKSTSTPAASKRTTNKKTVAKKTATTTTKRAPRKKSVEPKSESIVSSSGILDFGDTLVISNVQEWHQKIASVFDSADKIKLNGGSIEQIDGTGLQLVAAIIKEAAARNIEVTWSAVSETLRDSAAQLGLSTVLHLDATAD